MKINLQRWNELTCRSGPYIAWSEESQKLLELIGVPILEEDVWYITHTHKRFYGKNERFSVCAILRVCFNKNTGELWPELTGVNSVNADDAEFLNNMLFHMLSSLMDFDLIVK